MAESSVTGDSDVIAPYRFEPESLWSTSEESDSDDTNSQASFTERLGNTGFMVLLREMSHYATCCRVHLLPRVGRG